MKERHGEGLQTWLQCIICNPKGDPIKGLRNWRSKAATNHATSKGHREAVDRRIQRDVRNSAVGAMWGRYNSEGSGLGLTSNRALATHVGQAFIVASRGKPFAQYRDMIEGIRLAGDLRASEAGNDMVSEKGYDDPKWCAVFVSFLSEVVFEEQLQRIKRATTFSIQVFDLFLPADHYCCPPLQSEISLTIVMSTL